jgi:hypothetical protein
VASRRPFRGSMGEAGEANSCLQAFLPSARAESEHADDGRYIPSSVALLFQTQGGIICFLRGRRDSDQKKIGRA